MYGTKYIGVIVSITGDTSLRCMPTNAHYSRNKDKIICVVSDFVK